MRNKFSFNVKFFHIALCIIFSFLLMVYPAQAARDTDSFDGNIYPIYAGNGSLVPPQTTLKDALRNKRTSVIVYYLDDSATSKEFAPVVSGIKLQWGSSVDLLPLTTDELQGNISNDPNEPSFYWHGRIPQVVVINGDGEIFLDEEGQVAIDKINQAITEASGLEPPEFNISIKSFNEYNSEPAKEGYNDPRQRN